MKNVKTQNELDSSINETSNDFQTRIENLEGQRSGLVCEQIMSMEIEMYKTDPLSAETYKELPNNNRAGLNIKNNDMFCAIWSLLARMFPTITSLNCASSYKQHFDKFDITAIDFSEGLRIEDIPMSKSKKNLNPYVFEIYVEVNVDLSTSRKLLPIFISDSKREPKVLL